MSARDGNAVGLGAEGANRAGCGLLILALAVLPAIVLPVVLVMSMAGSMNLAPSGSKASQGANVEALVAKAKQYADDDSIGYSQGATRFHNPNMDCSSFVWFCLIDSKTCTTDELGTTPFWTGTEVGILQKAGWQVLDYAGADSLQRGDVLWRQGHTEIYLGDGQSIGAHADYDGVNGDSSGREVCAVPLASNWTKVLRMPASSGTGTGDITIPAPYGDGGYTVTLYTEKGVFINGHDVRWSAGTGQRRVHDAWVAAGAQWTDHIATIDGRYLIACTPKYGAVGDQVDFFLDDGTRIPCVIADEKNLSDPGINEWGHDNGHNVLEFEVERGWWSSHGNPGSSSWMPGWAGKRVASATNLGAAY